MAIRILRGSSGTMGDPAARHQHAASSSPELLDRGTDGNEVDLLPECLIIVGLVVLNGFFAGAEIAILTARRGRLEQGAAVGRRGAKIALELAGDAGRFLSTVQVGITVVGTLAAAYGGARIVQQLADRLEQSPLPIIAPYAQGIALATVTGTIAFLSLVLGELVPKRAALQKAEAIAQFVARPMYLLSVVARPVVAVLSFVTNLCLALMRMKGEREASVTIEDIRHLLEAGRLHGVLEEHEHEVAMEALRLSNRHVTDVMRPRMEIDAVDISTPSREVVGAIAMSGFSRLPVYEGDMDHIVGFVYIKDVLRQFYMRDEIDLRRIMRPPLFIPESLTLDRLLVLFQTQRTQLAIVVDEFGGTQGMVTFEDVLEELVGEIHDEHRADDDEQRLVRRDESSWLVDGLLPVHDLAEALPGAEKLPGDFPHVSTVAGLVLARLDRLPRIGDVVEIGQFRFEVMDMDGRRIDRVLITDTTPGGSRAEGAN